MATLTKDAIKRSFMKLLNQKPLNKITVKEIVEDCGINRNSFYYHFDDIPTLLEEIFNEQADEILHLSADASIYDCLMTSIDFALQNKSATMHIYNSANRDLFERYLSRISERAVREYITPIAERCGVSEYDRNVIVMYYKSLLIGFVVDWLGSGMKYDLTDQVKRICELFEGTFENAFLRSGNDPTA